MIKKGLTMTTISGFMQRPRTALSSSKKQYHDIQGVSRFRSI